MSALIKTELEYSPFNNRYYYFFHLYVVIFCSRKFPPLGSLDVLKIPGIGILDVMFSFSQQSPFAGEDEEDLFDSICRDKVHYPKWISQPAEDCLSQVGTVYRKSRKMIQTLGSIF